MTTIYRWLGWLRTHSPEITIVITLTLIEFERITLPLISFEGSGFRMTKDDKG